VKCLQVNFTDVNGGAARAAYRIHHALRLSGVDSSMLVNRPSAGDWTVKGPERALDRVLARVAPVVGAWLSKTQKTGNPAWHTPALIPSRWVARLNTADAEIVNLHWIGGEMISIADIGRIAKPLVWTLHDMWAFCGAEHYATDSRWRDSYTRASRPSHETGFDLNRWTFNRKRKHWTRPIQLVSPSRWLAECARQSVLMHDWPIVVIPNAIDIGVWRPVDKAVARQVLRLPPDVPLLLFGAVGGASDPRKGFDLLETALRTLRNHLRHVELVVFGQLAPRDTLNVGVPVHFVGHLHDDVSLRLLYSAADACVIPSRQDNFPNTGVEAQACGAPVVAFNTGGLPEIVSHLQTGYLADPFDADSLAAGCRWAVEDAGRRMQLGSAARSRAVALWSSDVVARQYCELYSSVLQRTRPSGSPRGAEVL
jgi:glycosyltransferase involved in cell wall biosynthesis